MTKLKFGQSQKASEFKAWLRTQDFLILDTSMKIAYKKPKYFFPGNICLLPILDMALTGYQSDTR